MYYLFPVFVCIALGACRFEPLFPAQKTAVVELPALDTPFVHLPTVYCEKRAPHQYPRWLYRARIGMDGYAFCISRYPYHSSATQERGFCSNDTNQVVSCALLPVLNGDRDADSAYAACSHGHVQRPLPDSTRFDIRMRLAPHAKGRAVERYRSWQDSIVNYFEEYPSARCAGFGLEVEWTR